MIFFVRREYMCDGSKELSCKEELEKAMENQYKIQQRQLNKIRMLEEHDYVSEVIDMLNGRDRYITIITDADKYTDYGCTCCQKGNTIYITQEALRFGMMQYAQGLVDINRIVRCLKDEGVLNIGTDSLTKKFKGKRHYLISVSYLKMYKEYKSMQDRKE